MPKKRAAGTVRVEEAAELLGYDAQTLRLILQTGEFPEIGGVAKKSKVGGEVYGYQVSKFKLFSFLGYDVNLSIEETLERVRAGNPPWINQAEVIAYQQMFGKRKNGLFNQYQFDVDTIEN